MGWKGRWAGVAHQLKPQKGQPTDLQLVFEEKFIQCHLRLPYLLLCPLPQKGQCLVLLLLVQLS